MRRALVTGGSGFVGRNLIPALRAQGYTVHALARSDGAARAVTAAGALAMRGDLDDAAALRAALDGCELAFHAAAKVEQYGRRADFLRVNVDGTQRLLDAARAAGVRRVVHVSTEAVLCGRPIVGADETTRGPARPIGIYAETKALAEERVRLMNGIHMETVIVRPRFIWGKGDTTLLPELVRSVKAGRFAWIAGGRYRSSTCHVRNVCEGAIAAGLRGRAGETYFLTDGEPSEFRELITRLLATQGVKAPERSLPRWVARAAAAIVEASWPLVGGARQPPLTRMMVRLIGEEVTVSDAKARRELGYTGAVTVDEGLAELAA
jgi:nucleoside-diphosphate-sugar epimerase